MQNELKKKLPLEFTSQLPAGTQLAYAAIPKINALPEALRSQVRAAFADSIRVVWYVMLGISALGLLSTVLMREVAMTNTLDTQWGLQTDEKAGNDTADNEKRDNGRAAVSTEPQAL